MNDEELKEIEERANAATAGPWETRVDEGLDILQVIRPDNPDGEFVCVSDYPECGVTVQDEIDLTFIAYAREDVPALVAEIRRLQGEVARALVSGSATQEE